MLAWPLLCITVMEDMMNINYTYRHETREWVATLDSYDGAPDARPCDRAMGFGETIAEAKQDLLYALEGFTA